jgi:hypothetical protein
MQRKTDRTFARRATVGLVMVLLVLIALPATASAARIIKYQGELSTADTVVASVLRRDNGRLFLRKLGFERLVFTCDEGDGDEIGISWVAYPGRRLDQDRSFAITESGDLVAGTLRWRHGEGTLEMSYRRNGDTCTTGELTWSVERTGWAPDPHA